MLVDTSGSTAKDWQLEVRSIGKFLKALFSEGNRTDTAALYTFNYDVTAVRLHARRATSGEQLASDQAGRRNVAVRRDLSCRAATCSVATAGT